MSKIEDQIAEKNSATPSASTSERISRRVEVALGAWAREVCRRRWLWLFVMLGAAVFLGSRVPHMRVETSTEDYLLDTDPAKIAYDDFRDQFGRDQPLLILVEPEEVFDLEFLSDLVALHRALEDSVPHLAKVTSLYNVRAVAARGDELLVDDLLETMPRTAADLDSIRARVFGTPSYLNNYVSRDGRIAMLVVEADAYSSTSPGVWGRSAGSDSEDALIGFDDPEAGAAERAFLTGRENTAFCRAVFEVVEHYRAKGFEIHLTGQPLVAFALTNSMAKDIPIIFGASLALIGICIVVLFRRVSPVLLSAAIVLLSLTATLGISELVGIAVGLPTQILPSFILAVAVGYTVHFLTVFFRKLAETGDRFGAIEVAMRTVGLPILMTGITTAAGLLSFLVAEMEQVMLLGVSGAIAVVVTLVHCLVFLPAMLAILPLRPRGNRGLLGGNAVLDLCARISARHPRTLIGVTLVLALGSVALVPSLDYSADPIRYFPPGHWLREATLYADARIDGMQSLEIILDTGRENGVYDPAVLSSIEELGRLFETLDAEGEKVGSPTSVIEVLKETHRALNDDRPDAYALAQDRALIAQELLLFEAGDSEDLESLVDGEYRRLRVSLRTGWEDGVEKQRFIERVRPRIEAVLGPHGEVELTGAVAMIGRTASATASSLVRSYTLALVLITPLMILLIGSWRAGFVSMVPNLVPILATLALMVLLGIELDMFTILGGCIAIGLAVDDSIHFIVGFQRAFAETGDAERAVRETIATTGRALLFTSVVLVAGFGVLGLSSMSNLANLGLLTAFAIALAFVLDLTVTPALLVLTHENRTPRSR